MAFRVCVRLRGQLGGAVDDVYRTPGFPGPFLGFAKGPWTCMSSSGGSVARVPSVPGFTAVPGEVKLAMFCSPRGRSPRPPLRRVRRARPSGRDFGPHRGQAVWVPGEGPVQVCATVQACGPGAGVRDSAGVRARVTSRSVNRAGAFCIPAAVCPRATATGVRLSSPSPAPVFSIGNSPAAADVDHLYLLAPDPSLEK